MKRRAAAAAAAAASLRRSSLPRTADLKEDREDGETVLTPPHRQTERQTGEQVRQTLR